MNHEFSWFRLTIWWMFDKWSLKNRMSFYFHHFLLEYKKNITFCPIHNQINWHWKNDHWNLYKKIIVYRALKTMQIGSVLPYWKICFQCYYQFWRILLCRYGTPQIFHADRGQYFCILFLVEFCNCREDIYNTDCTFSAVKKKMMLTIGGLTDLMCIVMRVKLGGITVPSLGQYIFAVRALKTN